MKNSNEFVTFNTSVLETKQVTKQTNRALSPIAQERKTIINEIDSNTRSVSSYFKELRKRNLEKWFAEAVKKGRKFDAELIHKIINTGELKPVTDTDTILQAAKLHPAKNWSGTRMFQAFIATVEIKAAK